MTTAALKTGLPERAPSERPQTVQELLDRLGDIPAERVRLEPPPGTATERDVIEIEARENRLCELVDGTLVEKATGYRESLLAVCIARVIDHFVRERNLGLVSGESGMMRLFPGLVRIPDVAFVSWQRIPGGRVPREPIPNLVPDLAVEVLSVSNPAAEMDRKRAEYFRAGVQLVWLVDPDSRTVAAYTSAPAPTLYREGDQLAGGHVLPCFELSVAELFAELDRQSPA